MTPLLDEFYAVLMGFGIRRDYIDYALLSALGIADGLALRGIIDDMRGLDRWAFGVGIGWLTLVCFRYMTSEGGAE